MSRRLTTRTEAFRVEGHGRRGDCLVRTVHPARGKPYEHTCVADVFREVAGFVERNFDSGFTGEEVVDTLDLPTTQVFVAIAFLDERGLLARTFNRRRRAAEGFTIEDALVEWHALREKGPSAAAFAYPSIDLAAARRPR